VQTSFCEPVSGTAMPAWKRQRTTGGGVLLDLASHHADLVRWILGDDIATVTASARSDESEHDSARVEMTTHRGVEVQSWFSFRSGLADYLELLGERGSLRVDRHSPRLVLRVPRRFGYGMRRLPVLPTPSAARWRVTRLVRPSVDPSYRRALQAFVNCLNGEPPSPASLADGAQSLAIVLAAERSVDGGLVEVACASS
jgi:myo-inositol 2-dehydrogenase/D-chiro-inositol 1-dehydrogenase